MLADSEDLPHLTDWLHAVSARLGGLPWLGRLAPAQWLTAGALWRAIATLRVRSDDRIHHLAGS